MNPVCSLTLAYLFAAERHILQRRKGEAAEPYINHLAEVAALVAEATEGTDVDAVVAAVLHDTVEDTDTSLDDIRRRFGDRVASLVAEVTDDTSLPKRDRKRLQVEGAPRASRGAKIIKLADKISNLRALLTSPPKGWPPERRVEYLGWSCQVAAGCRGVSILLDERFDEIARTLEQAGGLAAPPITAPH